MKEYIELKVTLQTRRKNNASANKRPFRCRASGALRYVRQIVHYLRDYKKRGYNPVSKVSKKAASPQKETTK